MTTADEAKDKLLIALPYMRHAAEKARKEGKPELAILSTGESGAGRIICRFEAEEFLDDLATLIGMGALTDEQRLDGEAKELVDRFGPIVSTPIGSEPTSGPGHEVKP